MGIVVGGLLVPLFAAFLPQTLPQKFAPLYPSSLVIPTALGVLVPDQIQSLVERFVHGGIFVRVSEVREIYMYYFVLLYLLDLRNGNFSRINTYFHKFIIQHIDLKQEYSFFVKTKTCLF